MDVMWPCVNNLFPTFIWLPTRKKKKWDLLWRWYETRESTRNKQHSRLMWQYFHSQPSLTQSLWLCTITHLLHVLIASLNKHLRMDQLLLSISRIPILLCFIFGEGFTFVTLCQTKISLVSTCKPSIG